MKSSGKVIPLVGQRFGFLVVLRRDGATGRRPNGSGSLAKWLCRCDCGEKITARGDKLRAGKKLACGINGHKHRALISDVTVVERRIFNAMIQRCYNKRNAQSYKNYGAKGVRVAPIWKGSFEKFLSDMGPRPSPDHSLDRYPDQKGNYEPGNVRWATRREQAQNTDACILVEIGGEKIPLIEHTRKLGINSQMVKRRLKRGWTLEDSLMIPSRVKNK